MTHNRVNFSSPPSEFAISRKISNFFVEFNREKIDIKNHDFILCGGLFGFFPFFCSFVIVVSIKGEKRRKFAFVFFEGKLTPKQAIYIYY